MDEWFDFLMSVFVKICDFFTDLYVWFKGKS